MGGAVKEADVTLVDPHKLERNPDNPRLIFREEDMLALQDSIKDQGILVPLTVYASGNKYRLLDVERRLRSGIKLGLPTVPGDFRGETKCAADRYIYYGDRALL